MISSARVRRSLSLLVAVSALVLGACGDDGGSSGEVPNFDGAWAILDVAFEDPVADAIIDENRPTLIFAGQKVSGFNGCNQYNGTSKYDTKHLEFSDLASTLIACESPASDIEIAYMDAMAKIAGYELTGTTLRMRDGDGFVLLTFGKD